MSLTTSIARLIFAATDRARDRGLRPLPGLIRFENVVYARSPERTLSLWYPEGTEGRLPVIVVVHGGGYVYGSAKIYRHYAEDLAARGFCVICFNYRLAPASRFPAPLEDLNETLVWMTENIGVFPFDISNVFFAGDSAGAQIASQYAAICSSPEYAGIMGIEPPFFRLAAMALNCGMYDITGRLLPDRSFLKSSIRAYFTGRAVETYGEKLNVTAYIGRRYPPCYLASSPGDILLTHYEPMMGLLKNAGAEVEGKLYGDEHTGHVFHLNVRSETAKQANGDEEDFFRRHLRL